MNFKNFIARTQQYSSLLFVILWSNVKYSISDSDIIFTGNAHFKPLKKNTTNSKDSFIYLKGQFLAKLGVFQKELNCFKATYGNI